MVAFHAKAAVTGPIGRAASLGEFTLGLLFVGIPLTKDERDDDDPTDGREGLDRHTRIL